MAFRYQIAYLDECVPKYLHINADEFHRVIRLIGSGLPALVSAQDSVEWKSGAKDLYAARLHEAERLAHDLRAAFTVAAPALEDYGWSLASAKAKVEEGDRAADMLRDLMAPIAMFQTPNFNRSEPLAQWEDLRKISWSMDAIAEAKWQDEIDAIRSRAETLYQEAAHAYDSAWSIERDAREGCITLLRGAFKKLPDFKADSEAAEAIIETNPRLAAEMLEAEALDENVRLPGQGPVPKFGLDSTDLSQAHQDIRDRAGNISIDGPTWGTGDAFRWYNPITGDPEAERQFKLEWIRAYSPVIQAAALEHGIPAEVLAGIVYQEVGGKPMWMDDAAEKARRSGLWPGDPDDTSFGPLAVQVDTAAKALGYDPDALTDKQREEVITSLKDPKQNIMITAKVLRDEKQSTDFAYTEPRNMNPDQGRQLAARYNAGPNWDGGDGQRYADNYAAHVDEAGRALR
jgi:hypothetical protein